MPQTDEAAAAFAANGERFDQDVVERFARFEPAAELGGLIPQLRIGHRLILRLQRADRLDLGLQAFEEPRIGGAEQAGDGPLKSAQDGVADPGEDFPDAFKNFHE